MLIQKTLTAMFLIALLFGNIIAQQNAVLPETPEISAELEKNAIDFLRQTIKEIPNLKTEANRQYFTIETARLLWKYDEKESRAMFESEKVKLKKAISQLVSEALPEYEKNVIGENYHRPKNEHFMQFQEIKNLRSHIIRNLAVVEPDLAYDFLVETSQLTPRFEGDLSFKDDFYKLEEKIIFQFIFRNETDKAIKVARGMLKEDFSDELVRQIKMIYENNPAKGSVFAEEVLQFIKSAKLHTNQNYIIRQLLEAALETKKQKNPTLLLSNNSIRDLAQFLGKQVLSIKKVSYGLDDVFEIADLIEKYASQEAKKIRERFDKKKPANAGTVAYEEELTASVKEQINKVVESVKSAKNEMKESEKREKEKEKILQNFKNENLTAEEKTQIIQQIKKLVSAMTELKRRSEKVKEIVFFASKSKDKEIISKLMEEATALIKAEIKSSEDYMSNWWLASGYSEIDTQKSFEVLEAMIPKFNQVIDGFGKIAEFLDDRSSIFANEEVKMLDNFSNGVGRSFFKDLTNSYLVIQRLAVKDFGRTKKLADKFEKREFKMTAKLMILDSLLNDSFEVTE